MPEIVDPHVASAQRALEAARTAKLTAAPPAWYADAVAAHAAAAAALDKAKLLCDDGCVHPDDADEEGHALAEFHHAAHRAVQEAAYAEFQRAGYALDPDTTPVPSNPATPGAVTPLAAAVAVNTDVAS